MWLIVFKNLQFVCVYKTDKYYKSISTIKDFKEILNQHELPTIADCQFLWISFIDHQIL